MRRTLTSEEGDLFLMVSLMLTIIAVAGLA